MSATVSPRRLAVLAVWAVATTVCLVLVATLARARQVATRTETSIERTLVSGSYTWEARVSAWAFADTVRASLHVESLEGNAAEVLWPDGLNGSPVQCPLFYPQGSAAPAWTEDESAWRDAAACPYLDAFVRASRLQTMDLTAAKVRDGMTPEELLGGGRAQGVLSGIGGLLARARLRESEGYVADAESDLRALVALGTLLVQDAPDIQLMQYGSLAVDLGLEHLAGLLDITGRAHEAVQVAELRAALPSREGCSGLVKTEMPYTATVDAGLRPVAAVAARTDLPLAIRLNALVGVRLGGLGNPDELMLGSTKARRGVFQQLQGVTDLQVWWTDLARFQLPLGRRAALLVRMLL